MIRFDFDWSDLLNQILLGLAVILLVVQGYWLIFRKGFGKRPALRIALNVVLWLSVLGFLLQPYWFRQTNAKSALLVAENVPASFANRVSDSLRIRERLDLADLESASVDTLVLVGQSFGPDLESKIARLSAFPVVRWVPFYKAGEVRDLHWKGILREGEMQVLRGRVEGATDAQMKVRYVGNGLDSVLLAAGNRDFKLQFPAFAQGRSEVELVMDDKVVDTIQFFARPSERLQVRFLLNSPDFESRNLASWLGRNGHAVQYDAVLSKGLNAEVNINKAAAPDLIITDPANAKSAVVKKAVAAGKSVLFINLTNPAAELSAINAALDTRFFVRKISNEETVRISAGLNALPYRFQIKNFQENAAGYPVMTEKTTGKVSVSLLAETFPVQLSGDSVYYDKIWNAILAVARPGFKNNVEIEAPVVVNVPTTIDLNGFPKIPKLLSWEADSVFLRPSLVNSQSAEGTCIPQLAGWQSMADSLEVFVAESTLVSGMSALVQSYQGYQSNVRAEASARLSQGTIKTALPDWFWFVLFLCCLAALWIEEKF